MRSFIIGMPFGMPTVGEPAVGELVAAARGVRATRAAGDSGRGGPRLP